MLSRLQAIRDLLHHAGKVAQFVCALHLAVTGQDLLEQGRARPRQSDDEDRRYVKFLARRGAVHEFLIEYLDDPVIQRFRFHRIVVFQLALGGVAFFEIGERLIVLLLIFVLKTQSIAEVNLGVVWNIGFLQQLLH